MKRLRVVHYLNQFFGQIGGEERASEPPQLKSGPVGPGLLLQAVLGDNGDIAGTVICGDDYFVNFKEAATGEVLELIRPLEPDILIAGPAFNAGRYGIACGEICSAAAALRIPCVTGMFKENPGVELYRRQVYIIETAGSAMGMKMAVPRMVALALKLFRREIIGSPAAEGYFPRGIRKNRPTQRNGAERAVELLLAKLSGRPYETEVSNPLPPSHDAAPPLTDIASSTIALVTEGALVPKGNPDRIEGSRCTKFGRYELDRDASFKDSFECIHRGFDISMVNEDANRLLPLDVLREMERTGEVGTVLSYFYSTCGCGTFIKEARRLGREIGARLKEEGANGVILSAT